jgi:tetrahydromethanopterin S-methyltransferase subunit G
VDKVLVARRVATKLHATEAAVDAALAEATQLMGEMIRGRQETKISAISTDPSMAKVSAAIAALSEARTAMVAAHGELDELRLRMGIRTRMDGAEDKVEQTNANLREVA